MYHGGSDMLGVLIAGASGKSLGPFLPEHFFAPLGMNDTAFCVPEEKPGGLATAYQGDAASGGLRVFDEARGRFARPPVFESAGGGLVSTIDDCFAFARMMLTKGKLRDARILSRPSVELMTTDHITPEQKAASSFV